MPDSAQAPWVPCPKCGRMLRPHSLESGDAALPIYSCDECLMRVPFQGELIELPLTFALDGEGRAFDPADPGGELQL